MDVSSIESRLARLERQNRLLKRAGAVVAVAVACVLLTGQGAGGGGQPVKASGFLLVDAKGKTAGMWGFGADGSPTFQLFDSTGKPRVGISVIGDKVPSLAFTDTGGNLRAITKVVEDGSPTLQLYDEKIPRIGLSVLRNGEPTMVLLDKNGKTRTFIKVQRDDAPVITLNDAQTRPRIGLRLADKTGAPSLMFKHEDDRTHFNMHLLGDGSPRLIMNDQHGTVLFRAP